MPSDDKSITAKEKSEEKRLEQKQQEKIAAKERQDEEKRAREIILEKSGRATKEHEAQKFAEEQQRIKENQLNEQKQNQNIIQHQNAGRSRFRVRVYTLTLFPGFRGCCCPGWRG